MKILKGKKLLINGEKINFDFIDRKSSITLFCIHGINSSKDFIGDLEHCETRYNIFTYSYGDIKNLKIVNFIKLAKNIINRYFQNKKLIIITHSFGAYITTKLFDNDNIIKYIFINPIHPLTFEYKPFIKTLNMAEKKSSLFKNNNGINNRNDKYIFSEIIEKRSKWYQIILEIENKSQILKKELQTLTNMKNKSVFIRSSGDFIISGKLLNQFLNQKDIICKVIHYSGHSPLIKETGKTYKLFDL